jgi:hypothetical protein
MTGSRTYRFVFAILFSTALLSSAALAQQPAPTISAGCGILDRVVTCNWAAFRPILQSSPVIAVEHAQIDRFTGRQLEQLVTHLGKTLASPDNPGNLTFDIVPTGEHGIDIGPSDKPILQLEVHDGPTSAGKLLWVETLRGDPDRPWPANVHAVIDQFAARLTKP